MPPSVREWLPAGHLAWYLLDVVERLDLGAFYGEYRADGSGRPAHDPGMMVALVLYAYAVGERSSRQIERRCVEDVAFRVIAANRAPDHTTIAGFASATPSRSPNCSCRCSRCARRPGWCGSGRSPSTAPSWRRTRGFRRTAAMRRSARRSSGSSPRPTRSTRPRTRGSAMRAVTSCRPSWPIRSRAASGSSAPSRSSRPSRPRAWPSTRRSSRVAPSTVSGPARTRAGARPAPARRRAARRRQAQHHRPRQPDHARSRRARAGV